MTPLPRPNVARIYDHHGLSKSTLAPQSVNGSREERRRSLGTQSRSLDVFLQEIRNTLPENRRPFIINLNGDVAILISIPRPLAEVRTSGKAFYHMLVDPWLDGAAHFLDQPDFVISLRHLEPAAYRSIAAVELLIRAIENAAIAQDEGAAPEEGSVGQQARPGIDLIVLSFGLTDHTHRPSLQAADAKTPVLAAPDAVLTLKAWDHFENVWQIPHNNIGNESPLPSWLNIVRLPSTGSSLEVTHGLLISWTFRPHARPEAILHAPHGVLPETIETVLVGSPTLQVLVLMHPVNETVTEGQGEALGVHAGLELYRLIAARYWLQIHDSDMVRTGLLAPFQKWYEKSLDEALEANPGPRPNFRARANGDIFVLA